MTARWKKRRQGGKKKNYWANRKNKPNMKPRNDI